MRRADRLRGDRSGGVGRRVGKADPLRVLIVNDWGPQAGGVETYLSWLRAGLIEAGDDVRLLTSSAGSAADSSADFVAFGTTRTAGQVFLQVANPAALLSARRAVRRFRPDVVHVTMFELFLSPAVFAAFRDVPTVLSISSTSRSVRPGSRSSPAARGASPRPAWSASVRAASGSRTGSATGPATR